MNTEKINPLEKHVEKMVLAVAAAGALYLGYLAIQPVEVEESGGPVAADQIEDELSKSLATVEGTESTNKSAHVTLTLPDYVGRYQNLVKNQPLDPKLFAALPQIGPVGPAVTKTSGGEERPGDLKIVTPTPAEPEFLAAESRQQPVATVDPAAALAQPVNENASLATRDQNAVLIQGYIPVAKMQAEMNAVKGRNERLPDALRQVSIYRIEVQRRERATNGGWTEWKLVTPTKATAWPRDFDFAQITDDDQARRIEEVNSEFRQIVLPDFYLDAKGQPIQPSILTVKTSKQVTDRTAQLQKELDTASGSASGAAPAPAAAGNTGDARAAEAAAAARGVDAGAATPEQGAPATPVLDATAIAALRTQPLVPFAFWDETVEPGREYQYQVRVRYLNPTFNWQWGLKDESKKKLATLDSKWVPVPGTVSVSSDVEFFVMSAGRGSEVLVRLYKHTNGKWYRGEISTQPGMGVEGTVELVDKKPRERVSVDTGWKIVDSASSTGGSDLHVVLADATGRMITRDANTDRENPTNKKLYDESQKPLVETPAVQPGRGTGTPTRGPQPTPRGTTPPADNFVDPRAQRMQGGR